MGEVSPAPRRVQDNALNLTWFRGWGCNSYGKITSATGGSLLNCPKTILSIWRCLLLRIFCAMLLALAVPSGISTLLRKATTLDDDGAPLKMPSEWVIKAAIASSVSLSPTGIPVIFETLSG